MFSDQTFTSAVDQEAAVPGLDQSYRQMSPGAFQRRAPACAPGLDIVREQANRRIENTFRLAEGTVFALFHLYRAPAARASTMASPAPTWAATSTASRLRAPHGSAESPARLSTPSISACAGRGPGRRRLICSRMSTPRGVLRDMTLWLDGMLWHASGATVPRPAELLAIIPGLVLDRLALGSTAAPAAPQLRPADPCLWPHPRLAARPCRRRRVTAQDMAAPSIPARARDRAPASRDQPRAWTNCSASTG